MKILIRWTIGNVCQDGIDILKYSINSIKKNYPNFERVVCFNNINKEKLTHLNAELFQQYHTDDIEYCPKNELWKLYPPRLDKEAHEIVIDNDLIIFSRIKEIDFFVKNNYTLMLRGRGRAFGRYDHKVPQPHAINGGLYGMPPYFDFAAKIKECCKDDKIRAWFDRSDDQGVIAYALFSQNHIIIEPHTILNYFPEYDYALPQQIRGVHLIRSNIGKRKDWRKIIYSHSKIF
jgi:hypothetical protein